MARSPSDSAGSQFFIMHEDASLMRLQPCKVIKGMNVVDAIAETPTNIMDYPTEPQVIKKATVKLPPDYNEGEEEE